MDKEAEEIARAIGGNPVDGFMLLQAEAAPPAFTIPSLLNVASHWACKCKRWGLIEWETESLGRTSGMITPLGRCVAQILRNEKEKSDE